MVQEFVPFVILSWLIALQLGNLGGQQGRVVNGDLYIPSTLSLSGLDFDC